MQIQIIQLMLTHIKIFPTKNTKWKSHCQPKKKKGLNMLKQESQDSGNNEERQDKDVMSLKDEEWLL